MSGCNKAAETPVWRFAIEETSGSVQDAYAQKFKELIEEKSGSKVTVKVYPYGTLGTSDQLTEQLHNGTLDFCMASPGHIGKVIPEVQVMLLHYILSDDDEINRRVLADPEVRGKFNELFSNKGFELLSFVGEGWQVWSANKPILKPSDFAGMKFRVMTTPLLMAAYNAYGASPTPLAFSEVYSALQLKMVDGQVNPIFAIEEMSFYEVNDHLIFAKQSHFYATCLTNLGFYEGLDAQEKRWVDESIEELDEYIQRTQNQFNEERLQSMVENNPDLTIIELDQKQRERFRELSLDVREEFLEMTGPSGGELLELILKKVELYQEP